MRQPKLRGFSYTLKSSYIENNFLHRLRFQLVELTLVKSQIKISIKTSHVPLQTVLTALILEKMTDVFTALLTRVTI